MMSIIWKCAAPNPFRHIRCLLLGLVVVALVGSGVQAIGSEELGRWRDVVGSAWKQTIIIVKEGNKFYRVSTLEGRGSSRSELREIQGGSGEKIRFKDVESSHGAIYAVDAAGNLDLYDSEGFIRKAKAITPSRSVPSRRGCPATTLYAKSRINIRGGPSLGAEIVRKAAPGETLLCEYSLGEWFRIRGGPYQEWAHSSVVTSAQPVAASPTTQESCYQLGLRFGRCFALSLAGRGCSPDDDIVKPARCMGDSSFDRGIPAGVKQVSGR